MLFNSNVFNILDWFVDGIEPRTGMYIRTISVVNLPSCSIQGPALDLKLYFNQFNDSNYGFGKGWEMNLPRIDAGGNGSDSLVLSDGSRYKILDDTVTDVRLQYKRTQIFKFFFVSSDTNGDKSYKIVYKDGVVDWIKKDRIVKRESPNGSYISFFWGSNNELTITDMLANELLRSAWVNGVHVMVTKRNTLHFYMNPENRCELETVWEGSDKNALVQLYKIVYEHHNADYLRIGEFHEFMNFHRSVLVEYKDMSGPEGVPGKICAVSMIFTLHAKGGYVTTTYSQPNNNYLGFPVVSTWNESGDNLENQLNFTYDIQMVIGSSRKIFQQYNRFYLLGHDFPLLPDQTPESPRNGKSTRYGYKLNAAAGIDGQCSTFTTPVGIYNCRHGIQKVDGEDTLATRTTYSFYEYDSDGNLLSLIKEDGTEVMNEYYPVLETKDGAGAVICPADPCGFVNYLKRSILIPSGAGQLLSKYHEYQYKKIGDKLVQPIMHKFCAMTGDKASDADDCLVRDDYEYEEAISAHNFGTLKKHIFSKNALKTEYDHSYAFDSNDPSKPTLGIKTRMTGFDGKVRTTVHTYDVHTGNCLSAVDENNLKTEYEYDALGRVVRKSYPWGMNGNTLASDTIVYDGMNSRVTRESTTRKFSVTEIFDGQGKVIGEYCTLKNPGEIPMRFDMAKNVYNNLGQLEKTTLFDFDVAGRIISQEVSLFAWDIFDEPISKTDPNGSVQNFSYDYYNNIVSICDRPGNSRTRFFYDINNFLIKTEKSVDGDKSAIDQTDTYEYDGFGRLSVHFSDQGEKLEYKYDEFDRVIKIIGEASGTRVTVYAPHSTAELPSGQKLLADKPGGQDILLGERTYDGLDRLESETVNQVKVFYDYTDSEINSRPRRISYEGGRSFEYKYSAALDRVISRKVIAKKEDSNAPDVLIGRKEFFCDSTTGLLYVAIRYDSGNFMEYYDVYKHDDFSHSSKITSNCWSMISAGYEKSTVDTSHSFRSKVLETTCIINNLAYVSESLKVQKKYGIHYMDGNIDHVNIYIGDQLRSSSYFLRGGGGVISRVDHYNCIVDNYFSLFSIRQKYGDYCFLVEKKYACDINVHDVPYNFMTYSMFYGKQGKIARVDYSMWGMNWTENYKYDKTGALSRWDIHGQVMYRTEYAGDVVSQSFSHDKAGNISSISTGILPKAGNSPSGTTTHYYYEPGGTRLRAVSIADPHANIPLDESVPDRMEYAQDAEGHVISESSFFGKSSKVRVKNYEYAGEDSFSAVSIVEGGKKWLTEYVYDVSGKIVRSRESTERPGEWTVTSRFYAEDTYLIEVLSKKEYVGMQYYLTFRANVFHVVNGEVAFISTLQATKNSPNWVYISTCPCLAQPNSSYLAMGEYEKITEDLRLKPGETGWLKTIPQVVLPAYLFHINAQSPYGFTYNAKEVRIKIKGGLYTLSAGQFIPYHGVPPDPPPGL